MTGRDVNIIFADTQPRDFQLISPNEPNDAEENESLATTPVSPAKIDTQTIWSNDPSDSMDPFFAKELRQDYPNDQPIDFVKNDENEAKLYSNIKKPKLNLRRFDSYPDPEPMESDRTPIQEERTPTLLELSRGISLRDSSKVRTEIEYEETDSSCSDLACRPDLKGEELTQIGEAWEDWDPFN